MNQHHRFSTNQYHAYDERVVEEGGINKYPCPCKDCLGGKVKERNVIYRHMIRFGHNGISPWAYNYYEDMIELKIVRDEGARKLDEVTEMFDEGFEVDRMLNEGLNDDWDKAMEDVLKPLYANCKLSHLMTILQILNLQVVHGWTNESVDQLLSLLTSLLLDDSILPTKQSQCKNKITKLGLGYENIHACVNGCVLFYKNLVNESECPKCHQARYKEGFKSLVPRKVLRHFMIIP